MLSDLMDCGMGTGGWTNVSNLYKWSVATSVGQNGEYWEPNQAVQIRIDRQYGAELVGFTSWSEVFCTVQTGGLIQNAYQSCVGDTITVVRLIDVD